MHTLNHKCDVIIEDEHINIRKKIIKPLPLNGWLLFPRPLDSPTSCALGLSLLLQQLFTFCPKTQDMANTINYLVSSENYANNIHELSTII